MLFERSDLTARATRTRATRRVWDGFVHGLPDCWVVVARDDEDLVDWADAEDVAVDEAPLRICTAILDDDRLVISDNDDDADPSGCQADLPCG